MSGDLLERRAAVLGPNVPTFYRKPVHLVRGLGTQLWDAEGRNYLDCYNNVAHVGHCHPKVVEAICTQTATLNTHTRYLHDGIVDYAESLCARLGAGFDQAIMVCTGSEANDIAMRMGIAVTGARGIISTAYTYHGNTSAVEVLSSGYASGLNSADHVEHVPIPGDEGARNGAEFGASVAAAIERLDARGHGISAMILCSAFVNEGFPNVERGFLDDALAVLRAKGGLFISDEVQPGFGRVGKAFWGFEAIGAVPDIVTIGKPMANGYPCAAVAASAGIVGQFRQRFRYFNTFGGNPVAMAAAMAVLHVIDEDGLVENARVVGAQAQTRLADICARYDCLDGARGTGMVFGSAVINEAGNDGARADQIVNALRAEGVLISANGPDRHVLKIRPPMVFSMEDLDRLFDALETVMAANG